MTEAPDSHYLIPLTMTQAEWRDIFPDTPRNDFDWVDALRKACREVEAQAAEVERLTQAREKLAKVEALCESWGIDYDDPAARLQTWADQQQNTTDSLLAENTGLREQLAEAQRLVTLWQDEAEREHQERLRVEQENTALKVKVEVLALKVGTLTTELYNAD